MRLKIKNYKKKFTYIEDQDSKYCKNCGKEFIEVENFN